MKLEEVLDTTVSVLRAELGDILYSRCAYRNVARNNPIEGISDISLSSICHGN